MDTESVLVAVLRGMLPSLEWKEPPEARTEGPRPLSLAKLRGPRDDVDTAA
jgi:hypothetical protein